ncbi:hypothetical protein ILUMI_00556 [Ignelater luminosus]|uniref:Mitochondrial dicarboxylate carrier n=1 Tax=Ignelater luminosus TaxID=2038154 RepID=A0A8K0DG81_IGNLU|nr:hypothetical protein ILUMI_00556 [Ignelater luminosus]
MADSKSLPTYTKFLFASLAGIGSAAACFPLDLLKTRMQVFGEGGKGPKITTFQLAKTIIRKEGILALYSGLSASIARQATYTGVRLGSFQTLIDYFTENGKPPNLIVKCLCGVVSGAVGGIAGLPADVALTRMAADGNAPLEKRRNYKHVIDAIIRICNEEGFFALYRGLGPTIARAAIINIAQLVSYSQTKEVLLNYGLMQENIFCHTTSSVVSAFVSTVCVLPADIAKTSYVLPPV